MRNTCKVQGCPHLRVGRGLCSIHYEERRKTGMLPALLTTEERFWEKVDKAQDCWLWTGAKNKKTGYGLVEIAKRTNLVHRYSYELHHGEIPKKTYVRHTCHTRLCVNPAHLKLGSAKQNVQDSVRDGRRATGERHGMAKLTALHARAIREDPRPQRVVAREYGVDQALVSMIRRGKIWKEAGGQVHPDVLVRRDRHRSTLSSREQPKPERVDGQG